MASVEHQSKEKKTKKLIFQRGIKNKKKKKGQILKLAMTISFSGRMIIRATHQIKPKSKNFVEY